MNFTQNKYDAIIVGGGHNGLVCAFYLAQKGLNTLVIERSRKVGGAAITEEFHPGFRNSVASYTVSLLQPKVVADMELERYGLKVVLRTIDNFLPGNDGYLLAGRDGLTVDEIARHSEADALAYPRYQANLTKVVSYIREFLLESPPNAGGGLADILALLKLGRAGSKLSISTQRDLLDFFTKSAKDVLDQYFENDLVKALFGFDATVGNFASPNEPGSAYVLLHHVFGEADGVPGAWGHAIGGMGSITKAMRRACEAAGVTIQTGQAVEEVVVEVGQAIGVKVEGQTLFAPIIASSVHPRILFEKLIDPNALPDDFSRRISQYKSHSGTFRMNVALNRLPKFTNGPDNIYENNEHLTAGIIIAPSLEYMDKAWVSAHLNGWSDKPIIEMVIPSTLDDTLALKDHHVASLFCQQFSYDLPHGLHWDNEREKAADHIVNTVEAYAPGFKDSIIGRQILSPLDIERRFGLIRGDIFHGRMSLDQLFSARPVLGHGDYRAPVKGLYMCGSGTHPGGGVTGAPGHNAARTILSDRRLRLFK